MTTRRLSRTSSRSAVRIAASVYNLFVQRPRPLVARDDRLTVRERVDYRGNVLVAARREDVERVCARAARAQPRGGRDLPAALLRQRRARARLARARSPQRFPESASRARRKSIPQYREYERFSTTVVNAVLAPIVARLPRAAGRRASRRRNRRAALRDAQRRRHGVATAILRATGGDGRKRPGERRDRRGGARAARIGVARLLSFDMGGTTAKAGAIVDGVAAGRRRVRSRRSDAQRPRGQRQRLSGSLSVRRSWRRSARAAARSRGSTMPARCASARSRRAPIPGRRATDAPIARRSPMRTSCSAVSIRAHCSAARFRSTQRAARAAVGRLAHAPWAEPRSDGRRHRAARRSRDGQGAAHRHGRARARSARVHARRFRRRRTAARLRGCRRARNRARRRPAASRTLLARTVCSRPTCHDSATSFAVLRSTGKIGPCRVAALFAGARGARCAPL